MNTVLQQITVGDWSDDGHEKKTNFVFVSNKTTPELQQAFLVSCETTGYVFDTNSKLADGSLPKARLLNKYDDNFITADIINELISFGMSDPRDPSECDTNEGMYFYDEDCFQLVMRFISVSIPDLEYETKPHVVEQVNGYWGNLNQSFGYGCFT